MNDYKKNNKYIGVSDYACLIAVYVAEGEGVTSSVIKFGRDGDYMAHLCRAGELAEIPSHYTKVLSGSAWLKIYDDCGLAFRVDCSNFEIYRAGELGCLISVSNDAMFY